MSAAATESPAVTAVGEFDPAGTARYVERLRAQCLNPARRAIADALYEQLEEVRNHGLAHGDSHEYAKVFKGDKDDAQWAGRLLVRLGHKIETDDSRWSFYYKVEIPSEGRIYVGFDLTEHEDTLYDAVDLLEDCLADDDDAKRRLALLEHGTEEAEVRASATTSNG